MRPILTATLLLLATAAHAQTTVAPTPAVPPATNGSTATSGAITTLAPTPNVVPERVAPADRAGNNTSDPAGPAASTPFSGAPQGGGGSQVGTSARGTEGSGSSTPSLGR